MLLLILQYFFILIGYYFISFIYRRDVYVRENLQEKSYIDRLRYSLIFDTEYTFLWITTLVPFIGIFCSIVSAAFIVKQLSINFLVFKI